jgi:hypothetical protein
MELGDAFNQVLTVIEGPIASFRGLDTLCIRAREGEVAMPSAGVPGIPSDEALAFDAPAT